MQRKHSEINASNSKLREIDVSAIERNLENPRIIFRQQEFDDLVDSIFRFGVQVPVSVYQRGNRFVLIDGERRWRSCRKLNKRTIPALVQKEPDRLNNLLLMFNIHGLREQWDLLTIALKLNDVIKLLEAKEKKPPTEIIISQNTGLSRAVIRRCKLLLDLPKKYHSLILKELHKPKSKQVFTEDFFIEMERSLKTVERAIPEAIDDKESVRKVLMGKFRSKVIDNRVHFRKIAKIANAKKVNGDVEAAKGALHKLFSNNRYSINEAFEDSVSDLYEERDILSRITTTSTRIRQLDHNIIDEEVEIALSDLIEAAKGALER